MTFNLNLNGRERSSVYIGGVSFSDLEKFIVLRWGHPEKIFILVDENTREHCLPVLLSNTPCLRNAEILEIQAGEKSKTVEMASQIWNQLITGNADRNSLLICLGGGMITDLGGFVAALFMRGIPFIHIPTSLMGMVDAAIGGKTAVNLKNIKNQVGSFTLPEAVFIFPCFLKTLGNHQLNNGFSEIVKYGLISDTRLWKKIKSLVRTGFLHNPFDETRWEWLICRCIAIKCKVVNRDFREESHRKILNFGHTIGHGLETFSMMHDPDPIFHGRAIAAGMICESYLSSLITGLSTEDLDAITGLILKISGHYSFTGKDFKLLKEIIVHDKKNKNKSLRFTLLSEIGNAKPDQTCDWKQVEDSLTYYSNLHVI